MSVDHTTSAGAARSETDQDEPSISDQHVFYSWSAQRTRPPITIATGKGCYFWDTSGNRYLDFASQFVHVNIGHQHPKVVAAIQEQAARLCTSSPAMANDQRSRAAQLIASRAPEGLDRIFFTNGGTEAIEHAVRMARGYTGRPKLLAQYRSYHGATNTSLHLTGDPRRWPIDTGTAGVARFFGPYLYRSAFHATTTQEECQRALRHLSDVIALEGAQTIAAIVLEPVVGTNGVLVPPDGYLQGVRRLCDEHGIILIADEVMAGFGRTGQWFAVDNWQVRPDLITFAKGVNSGYIPLGGVIISDRIAEFYHDRPYPGGLTYSGHPLACAAAVAAMSAMQEEDVIGNARRIGETTIGPALRDLASRHPCVGDVRGLGVFWALEMVRDRQTREPMMADGTADPAMEAELACRAAGLWPMRVANRIHVVPPCTISESEVLGGIEILDKVLIEVDRHVRS